MIYMYMIRAVFFICRDKEIIAISLMMSTCQVVVIDSIEYTLVSIFSIQLYLNILQIIVNWIQYPCTKSKKRKTHINKTKYFRLRLYGSKFIALILLLSFDDHLKTA